MSLIIKFKTTSGESHKKEIREHDLIDHKKLNLSNQNIQEIKFKKRRKCDITDIKIDLSNNHLKILDLTPLKGITISYLNVEGNQLEKIKISSHEDETLDEWNLSKNNLQFIDLKPFENSKWEGYGINLSDNKLTRIDLIYFKDLHNLNLCNNKLNSIFTIGRVRYIDLRNNQLKTINIRDDRYYSEDIGVDLTGNPVENITFKDFSSLELNIKGLKMDNVGLNIINVYSLTLIISDFSLINYSSLENSRLRSLKIISSENDIETLDIPSLASIYIDQLGLDFSKNEIKKVDFSNLENLRVESFELNLSENKLEILDISSLKNVNIKKLHLDLSNNNIEIADFTELDVDYLTTLNINMNYNRLREFQSPIIQKQLEELELHLNNNDLEILDLTSLKMKNIKNIHIEAAHNQLMDFNFPSFRSESKIEIPKTRSLEIDLSNNNLQFLDLSMLRRYFLDELRLKLNDNKLFDLLIDLPFRTHLTVLFIDLHNNRLEKCISSILECISYSNEFIKEAEISFDFSNNKITALDLHAVPKLKLNQFTSLEFNFSGNFLKKVIFDKEEVIDEYLQDLDIFGDENEYGVDNDYGNEDDDENNDEYGEDDNYDIDYDDSPGKFVLDLSKNPLRFIDITSILTSEREILNISLDEITKVIANEYWRDHYEKYGDLYFERLFTRDITWINNLDELMNKIPSVFIIDVKKNRGSLRSFETFEEKIKTESNESNLGVFSIEEVCSWFNTSNDEIFESVNEIGTLQFSLDSKFLFNAEIVSNTVNDYLSINGSLSFDDFYIKIPFSEFKDLLDLSSILVSSKNVLYSSDFILKLIYDDFKENYPVDLLKLSNSLAIDKSSLLKLEKLVNLISSAEILVENDRYLVLNKPWLLDKFEILQQGGLIMTNDFFISNEFEFFTLPKIRSLLLNHFDGFYLYGDIFIFSEYLVDKIQRADAYKYGIPFNTLADFLNFPIEIIERLLAEAIRNKVIGGSIEQENQDQEKRYCSEKFVIDISSDFSRLPPFYCQLCGIRHTAGTPRLQCDHCGRNVCSESFKKMLDAGRDKCPMCDSTSLRKSFKNLKLSPSPKK